MHSPSRKGHISCVPGHAPSLSSAQVLFFNLLVGAGIEAPLTVSSTASAAGVLAPLSTLLLSFPSRAGCLCTPSVRGHVLETVGMPAPTRPSTDLEGCEVHSPSPVSMPCVLPFGCQSARWVVGLRWQCLCALILSQPSMAGKGSSGQLFCGEEGEAESRATGALS